MYVFKLNGNVNNTRYFMTFSYAGKRTLAHRGRGKMVTSFHMIYSNSFSGIKSFVFCTQISLIFVPKDPFNNLPLSIQGWFGLAIV